MVFLSKLISIVLLPYTLKSTQAHLRAAFTFFTNLRRSHFGSVLEIYRLERHLQTANYLLLYECFAK